jgi:hypothetical protein
MEYIAIVDIIQFNQSPSYQNHSRNADSIFSFHNMQDSNTHLIQTHNFYYPCFEMIYFLVARAHAKFLVDVMRVV